MTQIDFHLNVEDSLQYTCRLIRKAWASGSKVVCYSEDDQLLSTLDDLLWTFSPTDFLPHAKRGDPTLPTSPIVLTSHGDDVHHHDLLINLDMQWPPFFARFDRLIEIVGLDEDNKAKARDRYRFYKERGYALKTFDIANLQRQRA